MELGSDFEDELQKAVLENAERELVGRRDNVVHQTIQQGHDILREYGQRHDYDVEPIIESLQTPEVVDRSDDGFTVRWGYDHEAVQYMEFGTSDHVVDGDPVLVFEFDASKYPYLAEMFPDGTAFLPQTEPSGLPESRFQRRALNWLIKEARD